MKGVWDMVSKNERNRTLISMFNMIGDEAAAAREEGDFDRFRDLVDLIITLERLYPTDMERLRHQGISMTSLQPCRQ